MKKYQRMTKAELIRCLQTRERGAPTASIAFEHERVLHELRVHQIELETQNRELREAQLLVEATRDRYADLYDFAPVGYVTLDAKGIIRELNLTAAGMLGAERTRLLGVPFHLHVAHKDLALFRAHLARLAKPEPPAVTELHLVRKGHAALRVMLQSVRVPPAGQRGFQSRTILTDLSARQQAEQKLRDNEARLRAVLDTAVDGIITVDEHGTIESVNPAAEMLFDCAAGAAVGLKLSRLILSPQREHLARHLAGGRKEGAVGHEAAGCRRDGTVFPVELSVSEVQLGTRRIYTVIVRDITRRKQAEEERQKFVSLVDSSSEFIGMCDREFNPLYLNAAGRRLVGLEDLAAVRRVRGQDFFFPEDQAFLINKFLPRARREGQATVQIRFRHFQTGAAIWMLYSLFTIRDPGGIALGWATVSRSLTERMELERQILDISEREQRQFAYTLHDGLGQHLTGLEMWSHELIEEIKLHAPALVPPAERLNRELRETVTEARLLAHNLAPVSFEGDGLVRGLTSLAASISRLPGVKCRFISDPPVQIQDVTVATHLYRIAQEAVNNALKHGKARQVDITLTEQREGVELSVENNGQPFPAAPPAGEGLGLNIMRHRAELIGASLLIGPGERQRVRVACTLPSKP